jgi:hypothetical protein
MIELWAASLGFGFILLAVTWLSMPVTLAMIANEKGRSVAAALLLGLLLPIPALIYYLAVPSLRPAPVAPTLQPFPSGRPITGNDYLARSAA